MNTGLYPCLWFDNQGKEAADLYCSVFEDAAILAHTPMVTTFKAEGVKLMALNGGPYFKVNPAVSYYVYCSGEEKFKRLYEALSAGGGILMPPGRYAWSEKYAWIADRYGVNWQLDINKPNTGQKIVPALLFANNKMQKVREARDYYCRIFPDSRVLMEAPYGGEADLPEGTLLFTRFQLNGFTMNATSSTLKHDFDFTEGNSFVVECETQEEIDRYWTDLTDGGEESQCGWLKDRFGVSWQIIPSILGKLMTDPAKSAAVNAALMKMKKIDLGTLKSAG